MVRILMHDFTAVPIGRAPATIVLMGIEFVKDKPAALHFGKAESFAAFTGHLRFIGGKVHMFGSVAVDIINPERALTVEK